MAFFSARAKFCGRIRRMESTKNKVLFVVWALDSVVLAWLFVDIYLHGSTPENVELARYLGALWGGTAAFLTVPIWKALQK